MKRVGIDIGGTFTDFFYWDNDAGHFATLKVPSTPEDPSVAGIEGLRTLCRQVGIDPGDIDLLFHGTTVATNIILEHNGARVGLITTAGFRDILHIGRKNRPLNFSHYQDVSRQVRPIVQRRHRKVVTERVSATGAILTPLDRDAVRQAVRELKSQGVEAIAVCCLFSFLNDEHEQAIGDIIEEEFPAAYVSLSHAIVPLYREYERFSTTALNAYVGPKTANYLDGFAARLAAAGLQTGLNLMSSAGGAVGAPQARRAPVSLLLSGPVGALLAGVETGKRIGHSSVITLDVGGTSADIGVAPRGELRMKHLLDTRIGDYDAMVPMVDIDTIGAGGGSIAHIDEGGMFRVGPRSAGAYPGPACYGHGGIEATVTDAIVCLGWFRGEALQASGLNLEAALAREVIEDNIARPLAMEAQQSALGIYQVVTTSMVEAIRVNSVSKGYDPRDFALLAYGGAGAAFAVEVGRQLQVAKVVVPPHPGVGAASGLLDCDVKYEHMSTVWMDLERPDLQQLENRFAALARKVRENFNSDICFAQTDVRLQYKADCRYRGQGYELTVEVPAGEFDQRWTARVREAFHRAHETAYLRRFEDTAIQLINIRVIGFGAVPRLDFKPIARRDSASLESGAPQAALICRRQAWFRQSERAQVFDTPFYQRERLRSGDWIAGPAIVEQPDTTTVIIPGAAARVDDLGNLIITFSEAAA